MQWLRQWMQPRTQKGGQVQNIEYMLDAQPALHVPDPHNLVYTDPESGGRIWLGGITGLHDRQLMQQVDAVVSLVDARFPATYVQQYVGPDKAWMYVQLEDAANADIAQYFRPVREFLNQYVGQGKDVYIHCVAGMSRSSTVLAHWLMRRYPGMSAGQALQLLKRRRPIVRPNCGFIQQLVDGGGMLPS